MPAITTWFLAALPKLVKAGMAFAAASKSLDFDEDDVKALADLVSAFGGLPEAAKADPGGAWSAHRSLVLAAFLKAYGKHWAGTPAVELLAKREHNKDVEARVELALKEGFPEIESLDPAGRLEAYERLGAPTRSPLYQALWRRFTDTRIDKRGKEHGARIEAPKESRREFERDFYRAFANALATPSGNRLRTFREHVEESELPRIARELIALDVLRWRGRHVFGNVASHEALPDMPLGTMYVQPFCRRVIERHENGPESPVLEVLEEAIEAKTPLIVVRADMGHGKSLSARMLAVRCAERYLHGADGAMADVPFPLFVRCADHLRRSDLGFKSTASRALQQAWKEAGGAHDSVDAAAFTLDASQRYLLLIDGFDEVVLDATERKGFLSELADRCPKGSTVVVFSRPPALPDDGWLLDESRSIPTHDLLPFQVGDGRDQVAEWIERWNRCANPEEPVDREALAKAQGGEGLERIPILLFMLGFTWKEHRGAFEEEHIGVIYRAFFEMLARSKYDARHQKHKLVVEASKELTNAIEKKKRVDLSYCEDKEHKHQEAMLWLMSRIAWEHEKRALAGKSLTEHNVDQILIDELDIEHGDKVFALVRDGLMLAMQADLRGGSPTLLFGHRSFVEYLLALYWLHEMRGLCQMRKRKWRKIERRRLLGPRLMGRESKIFAFLRTLLRDEDEESRRKLSRWSEATFRDDMPEKGRSIRGDRRLLLREAALAIHVELASIDGREVGEGWSPFLRSLLGAAYAADVLMSIYVCGVNLNGVNLVRAVLIRANITNSKLIRANIQGANLYGSDVSSSVCDHSIFYRTIFEKTNMNNASFVGAFFDESNLEMASIRGADLRGASFVRANLRGANLKNANLKDANFFEAYLEGANFEGAYFEGAYFRGANLMGANLKGVKGLHLARNLDKAYLPEGFALPPPPGEEDPPDQPPSPS